MSTRSKLRSCPLAMLLPVCLMTSGWAWGADEYQQRVLPFFNKYCISCHNSQEARGELDLSRYSESSDVTSAFRRFGPIIEFIRDAEMPPAESEKQPTPEERTTVVRTLNAILATEAKKHAGDPGVVLPRRLSNTEYNLSIRDLTGIDIQPTKTFPADPAAGEGFDNTGEALSMSPSLLKKYLAAAQEVSHHLVLKPDGITFAPFPVTSYNERKKLTEQAIIDFYERHNVEILDYLTAAWRYRYRGDSERELTIEEWAERSSLSGRYLALVWKTLGKAESGTGYLKTVGELWNSIPAPSENDRPPEPLRKLHRFLEFCRRTLCHREESLIRSNAGNWPISHLDFRAKTASVRDQFDPGNLKSRVPLRFDRLRMSRPNDKTENVTLSLRLDPVMSRGENFVVVHRPIFSKSGNPPRNVDEAKKHEVVTLRSVLEQHAPELVKRLAFGRHPKGHEIDADSFVVQAPALVEISLGRKVLSRVDGMHLLMDCELDPTHSLEGAVSLQYATNKRLEDRYAADVELLIHADSKQAKQMTASAETICYTFPNRFAYVNDKRGLAAGFHLVEGFFRDDQPLTEKVLNDQERQELNQLWEELDFVTSHAETLLRGFVWFERSERHVLHDERFDFLRAEDPELVTKSMLDRFEKAYLEKMGVKLVGDSLKPEKPDAKSEMIQGFFEQIRSGLKRRMELIQTAEELAWRDMEQFAERAYRRPLTDEDKQSLKALYRKLREQGQDVETSLRGVLTAILMSPKFCYRYTETALRSDVVPLSDHALAGRLSYFLWSSLPDEELFSAAAKGQLQDETELLAQTRRMLKDPKVESFAREFFGQWLRYRDYLANDPVNGDAFPSYTDELRQAMFAEPIRLATNLIQHDKPIMELLNSDATFVNGVLAKHYGGDIAQQYAEIAKSDAEWHRVEGLHKTGRGGMFGMAVLLTNNSRGERTSPVRRGFWTVHHLLGQHFPPPPADVPELPPNEKEASRTIRELLAAHTADAQCVMCHKHFDSLGLAMEGFDPIGRARTKDLAGRPIDNVATLPNGKSAEGIPDLIKYIEQHRRQDFVETLCRKFLGYALGRSVELSDQPLLDEMKAALEKNDYRFSVLFETVVKSPQFRKARGGGFAKN